MQAGLALMILSAALLVYAMLNPVRPVRPLVSSPEARRDSLAVQADRKLPAPHEGESTVIRKLKPIAVAELPRGPLKDLVTELAATPGFRAAAVRPTLFQNQGPGHVAYVDCDLVPERCHEVILRAIRAREASGGWSMLNERHLERAGLIEARAPGLELSIQEAIALPGRAIRFSASIFSWATSARAGRRQGTSPGG